MSANPLLTLRQALKSNPASAVTFLDDEGNALTDNMSNCRFVQIGQLYFLKDASTSFKSKRGSGPPYSVESVAFLFKLPYLKDLPYTEYLQLAKKASAAPVSLVDKKELVAFIEGQNESSNCIDQALSLVPAAQDFESVRELSNVKTVEALPLGMLLEPASIVTRPIYTSTSLMQSSKVLPI